MRPFSKLQGAAVCVPRATDETIVKYAFTQELPLNCLVVWAPVDLFDGYTHHQWQPWCSQEHPSVSRGWSRYKLNPPTRGLHNNSQVISADLLYMRQSSYRKTETIKKRSPFTHIPQNNPPNNHNNNNNNSKAKIQAPRPPYPLPFLHLTGMVCRRIETPNRPPPPSSSPRT